jgi:signal peptidase II
MKVWYRLIPPILIALALDGATKIWAEQTLEPYQPVPVIGEYFRLTLGYNTGVAFGLFANLGVGPLIVTGAVIVGLAFWLTYALRQGDFPAIAVWPMGLLLGGAVANFIDRLLDGRVIDFLDVGLGALRWPTFNLADSLIVVSLLTLMVISLKPDKPEPGEQLGPPDKTLPDSELP